MTAGASLPKSTAKKPLVAFAIEPDGLLVGYLPAYRVVCVTVDPSGKAKVERSSQRYVIGEALAIVEDKTRNELNI